MIYLKKLAVIGCFVSILHTNVSATEIVNGLTYRVSVDENGSQLGSDSFINDYHYGNTPIISGNGRYTLFQKKLPDSFEYSIFRHDNWLTAQPFTEQLYPSSASGSFESFSLSANGNYAVFSYSDDDLVGKKDRNRTGDVFIHNFHNNTNTIVSLNTKNKQFSSASSQPTISSDGRMIAFVNEDSIYIRDTIAGTTKIASSVIVAKKTILPNGPCLNPMISADGNWLVFTSYATNLSDKHPEGTSQIYLKDLINGSLTLVSSKSTASSQSPNISADGRYVVFDTDPVDPTLDDDHVYVFDRQTALIKQADRAVAPKTPQGSSAQISADGHYVVYDSYFIPLTGGDSGNGALGWTDLESDKFGVASLYQGSDGFAHPGENITNEYASISASGRFIAFDAGSAIVASAGTPPVYYIPTDTNDSIDVFVSQRDFIADKTVNLHATHGKEKVDKKKGIIHQTLDIKNLSDTNTANNIELIMALPYGASASVNIPSVNNSCKNATGVVVCHIDNLTPNSNLSIAYDLTIDKAALKKSKSFETDISVQAAQHDDDMSDNGMLLTTKY